MYIRFYGKCKQSRKNGLLIYNDTLQSNYFIVIASSIY